MALLTDVKTALRISHTKLDTEITAVINAAQAEMARAGIVETAIVDTDPLIVEAIKTYCKHVMAGDEKRREGFFVSWQYQLDCLRKSSDYAEVTEDV